MMVRLSVSDPAVPIAVVVVALHDTVEPDVPAVSSVVDVVAVAFRRLLDLHHFPAPSDKERLVPNSGVFVQAHRLNDVRGMRTGIALHGCP